MKKNILVTMGMALALFVYGYLASSVGHDHDSHGADQGEVKEQHSGQSHDEHEHQH